jgi:hypothetical protein
LLVLLASSTIGAIMLTMISFFISLFSHIFSLA